MASMHGLYCAENSIADDPGGTYGNIPNGPKMQEALCLVITSIEMRKHSLRSIELTEA